jgi:adenosine deaminase
MAGHRIDSRKWSLALVICLVCVPPLRAQTAPPAEQAMGARPAPARQVAIGKQSPEQRTSLALETARANPLELRSFLRKMPKGADLHNHLGGAIYAESLIRAGAEDGLCVNTATLSYVRPQISSENAPPPAACGEGKIPVAQAFKDQHLYDALIDAFSMRGFVPSPGITGHDHFFDAFAKSGGIDSGHKGEWLDEVATRAAAQNEQYLELMETPDFSHAAKIAYELGWTDDFAKMRDALLAHGLRDDITTAKAGFDRADSLRREREHCGMPEETPACKVEIRYLYQVLRGFPKQQVFAQALLGFETASADPRVVGLNFVMPEDGYTSMNDYALHMKMVGFLHQQYPKVHISMHAGELAPGLVPYEGLCCHIRLAVEQAHAERIGHGVDIMYEEGAHELLKEMAAKHVMVEISLTSNDVILGIAGNDHPLPLYRSSKVPVALATDDEGVSRINLTNEYFRAIQTYGLKYADLKTMVRTGIEHSFLPGDTLWRDPDVFKSPVAACSGAQLGTENPTASCAKFLDSSEKARQQWELERRLRIFEANN